MSCCSIPKPVCDCPMAEPCRLRSLRFDGGAEDGARLIEVENNAGLSVDLLPDRCLDLGLVRYRGAPFGWLGENGLAPARPGEMDQALGGLLCTCGFDHIRQPVTEGARHFPLHGSMSLRRARVTAAHLLGDGSAEIRATVAHGTLSGQSWRLDRRVIVPPDRAEIHIEDRVAAEASGEVTPIMALYHINLGAPLIGPQTRVEVAARLRPELPGTADFTACEPAPAGGQPVRVSDGGADPRCSFRLRFDGQSLPWLQFHRRPAARGGLFCIEPATHDRRPRAELLRDAVPLDGSIEHRFRLILGFGPEVLTSTRNRTG